MQIFDKKNQKKIYVCLILGFLLIVATLAFLYWSGKKEIWFCDEVYSYESANGFEQAWPVENYGNWIERTQMVSAFAADADTLSLDRVAEGLFEDHVPLYFWIFRCVSFFFFHGSCSVWIGLSMNLVCYLVFLAGVFWLFYHTQGKAIPAAAVVLIVGIGSRLCIEQAMYLRMYQMLLMWEVLFLAVVCILLEQLYRGDKKLWIVGYLYPITVAGMLTHYTFWIFYGICAAVLGIYLAGCVVSRKTYALRYLMAWIINGVLTFFTVNLLFPVWSSNLKRGNGELATRELLHFSRYKLRQLAAGYSTLSYMIFGERVPVIAGLVIAFGSIVAALVLLFRRGDTNKCKGLLAIVLITQLHQWVLYWSIPDITNRYLWSDYTIFMLCFAWSVLKLLESVPSGLIRKMIGVGLAGVLLFAEGRIVDGGFGMEYLFQPGKDVTLLREYEAKPWIVYGPTMGVYSYYDWTIPAQICFLSGEKTDKEQEALSEIRDETDVILYVYEGLSEEAAGYMQESMGKRVRLQQIGVSGGLTVYLVSLH